MMRGVLVAASLLAALSGPTDDARAQIPAPQPAPAVDLSPEAVRLAELETLREREQQSMRARRGFAYATLGGGVVLTVGVAMVLRHACWVLCDERTGSAVERAAAGLMVVGLTTTVVSSLAVAVYGGSGRQVRRRMVELSVTPTASLRSVGARLDFAW